MPCVYVTQGRGVPYRTIDRTGVHLMFREIMIVLATPHRPAA
jgi:hypothetical protein